MKKKNYLLIVIVAPILIAQSCKALEEVAPEAGVQKSSLVGHRNSSYNDAFGVQAGVIATLADFGESMSLRAEVNLSMQVAKWEDQGLKGSVNLLYANVPLAVRYQTKCGFFGEAAIQPGFLLSAKDKYSGTSHDYKDYVKKFDFGIPFGVGYEFKNNFGVGLRVIPGLTNINTEGTEKDRNFVVALGGTYTFQLK